MPPSTSDVGSLVKLCQKGGSFSEIHQKIVRAFRAKMAKNFSTFCQIGRNFRKILFFTENCHFFFTIKRENEGSVSDKDVSGSFGDNEFVKNRGSLGESW